MSVDERAFHGDAVFYDDDDGADGANGSDYGADQGADRGYDQGVGQGNQGDNQGNDQGADQGADQGYDYGPGEDGEGGDMVGHHIDDSDRVRLLLFLHHLFSVLTCSVSLVII